MKDFFLKVPLAPEQSYRSHTEAAKLYKDVTKKTSDQL